MGNAQGLEQPERTYEAGFHVLQVRFVKIAALLLRVDYF
jgi:hypothetical protein